LTAIKKPITDFLRRHNLDTTALDLEWLLNTFLVEMDRGLKGEPSSLPMIPTFIPGDHPLPRERRVVVLDAGGTNLRLAAVSFDAASRPTIERFEKYRMPGVDRELTRDAFFQAFSDYIMPFSDYADAIGFCFSYPTEISPGRDGKLLHWTKEIKAPGVEGHYIGRHLQDRLATHGYSPRITVLNDTIATLLAGQSAAPGRGYAGRVGFILGTGTNTAYVEHNTAITKRADLDPDLQQAINVEAGSFGGVTRGDIDTAFDKTTANPGRYAFEKMVAGAYLGGLCLTALKTGAREGLFRDTAADALLNRSALTGRDLDAIVAGDGATLFSPCTRAVDASADGFAVTVCRAVVERAARLSAVNICAAVLRPFRSAPPANPICINIDGSTFYALPGFKQAVETHMHSLLTPRGVSFELVHVENAPVIGAAIAGLL
jgi:hexokinase